MDRPDRRFSHPESDCAPMSVNSYIKQLFKYEGHSFDTVLHFEGGLPGICSHGKIHPFCPICSAIYLQILTGAMLVIGQPPRPLPETDPASVFLLAYSPKAGFMGAAAKS